jgi:hypothetical protein
VGDFVNTVTNLRVRKNVVNFLSGRTTAGFSDRTNLYGFI